jgi:NAD(P)-dependent dehydrogenase (short-subunit alcohol dehydrogenase family)
MASTLASPDRGTVRTGWPHHVLGTERRRPTVALALFGALFALYALTTSGFFRESPDTAFMWGVSQSVMRSGHFDVTDEAQRLTEPYPGYDVLRGPDGLLYFPKGMSYSVALIPFNVVGELLYALFPAHQFPDWHWLLTGYTSSFATPLFGALACTLLYLSLVHLRYSPLAALSTALAVGLATTLFTSSRSNYSEPFNTLMVTITLYCMARLTTETRWYWSLGIGLANGSLFLSQPAMLPVFTPPALFFATYVAWRYGDGSVWTTARRALPAWLGTFLMLGILAWLALIRYGTLSSGYERWVDDGKIQLYIGVYGILFSSGKSIFLYSPPLILAVTAMYDFVRRVGALALFCAVVCAAFILAYGSLWFWNGDGFFGNRYMVPILPLFGAALAEYVDRANRQGRLLSRLLWLAGFVAVGCAFQLIGMTTENTGYFLLFFVYKIAGSNPLTEYESLHFNPAFSAIVAKWYFLVSWVHAFLWGNGMIWHVRDHAGNLVDMDLGPFVRLDYWPLRFKYYGAFTFVPGLVYVIWGIALGLASLFAFFASRLWRVLWSELRAERLAYLGLAAPLVEARNGHAPAAFVDAPVTMPRPPVVLVTDATSRTAKHLAEQLLRRGASVVAIGDDPERLAWIERELGDIGPAVQAIPCNVRDRAGVERMAAEVLATTGCPDIVITGGGATLGPTLEASSAVGLDGLIQDGFLSAAHVTRAFLAPMTSRGSGTIVTLAPLDGRLMATPSAAISAAHQATLAWAEALRDEVAPFGVNIQVVCPARAPADLSVPGIWEGTSARREPVFEASPDAVARAVFSALASGRFVTFEPRQIGVLSWLTRTFPWFVKPMLRLARSRAAQAPDSDCVWRS